MRKPKAKGTTMPAKADNEAFAPAFASFEISLSIPTSKSNKTIPISASKLIDSEG